MSKKERAIDFATEHFSTQTTKKITVPEWQDDKGKPLEIFYTPMNLAEKRKLFRLMKNDDVGALADLLIMKAKDADGERLFKPEDKDDFLFKVDPDVLSDVASKISITPQPDELKKN
jgi:hypothetical protein